MLRSQRVVLQPPVLLPPLLPPAKVAHPTIWSSDGQQLHRVLTILNFKQCNYGELLPSDNQTLQWTISHLCTSMTIHKNLHLVRGFPRQPCSEGSSHFELNPAQRRLWVVLHHSNGKIHVSTQVPSRHSPSRPGHWTRWTHAVFQGVHPHEKGCSIISSHVTVYIYIIYIYKEGERERGGDTT